MTASYGAGSGDVYLIKLDSNGDSIWAKTYGGSNIDCGNSVQQTVDNGYIVTGYTYSSGAGGMDIYLVKTDNNGTIAWTRTYGTSRTDRGFDVIQLADGGYVVAGGNGNALLLKYTENGDLAWANLYGQPWHNDYALSVKLTPDNYLIFTGYTRSFSNGTYYNVYLVKTDINGNTLWERAYGGWQNDYGHSIILANDGCAVVTGYSTWQLNHNALLLKTPLY
jgi:hypothetical protein